VTILKRQNTLYQQVAFHFEKEIKEGRLKPGSKLPSTSELSQQLGVNPETIQLGLKILMNQGLISRTPKRGTFVRNISEEKTLGIVFPFELYNNPDAAFFPILFSHLTRYAAAQGWKTRCFVTSQDDKTDIVFYELRKAIDAGEITALSTIGTNSTVSNYIAKECNLPLLHHLTVDRSAMITMALERLFQTDLKLIDIFYTVHDCQLDGSGQVEAEKIIASYCKKYNRDAGRLRLHVLPGHYLTGYEKFKELWTTGTPHPDGLVITSDTLFRGIWYAIMELKISVPDELKVITHVNKGFVPMTHIPLTCLEVSPQEVAEKSFDAFCKSLRGEKLPEQFIKPILIDGKTC